MTLHQNMKRNDLRLLMVVAVILSPLLHLNRNKNQKYSQHQLRKLHRVRFRHLKNQLLRLLLVVQSHGRMVHGIRWRRLWGICGIRLQGLEQFRILMIITNLMILNLKVDQLMVILMLVNGIFIKIFLVLLFAQNIIVIFMQ